MSKHTVGSSPWPNCSSVFSAGESRAAEWTLSYSPGNRIEALAVLPLTWGSRCCLGSSRKAEQKGRTLGLGPVLVIQVRGTSLSLDDRLSRPPIHEPGLRCRSSRISSLVLKVHPRPWLPHEGELSQSCPTLCNPMDYSLPGSSLHGILQARVLEWVAISFSRGSSQFRDQTGVSRIPGRHFNLWATREAAEIASCLWVFILLFFLRSELLFHL